MSERAVPLTVLGGYLGAGKTTLLNRLLSGDHGRRVAVVVNDFGSVDVDADLVRARHGDTVELSNGCVCCSLTDGMAEVVRRLSVHEPPPDAVVVEVSGVGDPAAVATWGDHPGFRRGPVVVAADLLDVRRRAADRWVGDTVRQQLAAADVIALTKADLVDTATAEATRSWLAGLAPRARLADAGTAAALLLGDRPSPAPPAGADGTPAGHPTHRTWSATGDRPVDTTALRRLLGSLPGPVVRAKGVLRTAEAPDRRTVVQLAAGRLELHDDGPWVDATAPSRLVVIARPGADDLDLAPELSRLLGAPDVPS